MARYTETMSFDKFNLDKMLFGYCECALFSTTDKVAHEPLDENFTVDDIDSESLKSMRRVCDNFVYANPDDIGAYLEVHTNEQLGHDFWLTRNGHGAGFWDRGLGSLGERLTMRAWMEVTAIGPTNSRGGTSIDAEVWIRQPPNREVHTKWINIIEHKSEQPLTAVQTSTCRYIVPRRAQDWPLVDGPRDCHIPKIEQAKNEFRASYRRNMREWPICPFGGTVELCYIAACNSPNSKAMVALMCNHCRRTLNLPPGAPL